MPVLTRRQKQTEEQENERRLEKAVLALHPLGFDRELIVSTIRGLLQVYRDGDQLGWKGIQDNSYSIVIDKILEENNNDSQKRDELDDKENNTKQAKIHSDVKFGENNLEAEADTELHEDKADRSRQSVARTESQLSSGSVLADRDGTFTCEDDIGTSSAEVDEVPRCSSDRDGQVDRNVLPSMLDPLDDSSVSVKAEVVGQKAIGVGNPDTGSLQGSLGCKIKRNNSWERVGEDEAHDLMWVGKKIDIEERNNIDTKVVLNTSSVLEVKKINKEQIVEQSVKDGDGCGQRSFLSPIFPTSVTSSFHASTENLEPGEIPSTADAIQKFLAQSRCNESNYMVPLNPVHVPPTLQVEPGNWGYGNCSVPVSELQKQEASLYFSNKNNFSEGRSTVPLKRKPCHGWLSSDEELSPREQTISMLGNEVVCSHSEMAVRENDLSEISGSGRNIVHETNINPSIQSRLPDKSSTEYDCKHTKNEKDIRGPADRLIQQYGNLSEDIVDKYGRDKYEYHNARKSVEMKHQKLPHGIGISSDECCKFHKVQEERNDRSTKFKTSNKSGSSQDEETVRRHKRYRSDWERSDRERYRSDRERHRSDRDRHRSDQDRYRLDRERYRSGHERYISDSERYKSGHRNDRMDRKKSHQPMDKHSSRHEKTSADILKDEYQKKEHRRKKWIEKVEDPVERTTGSYTKERYSEYRERQGYRRKSENIESRSYENRDSEKQRSNKCPLLHENNFSQESKLGTGHDHALVRDEGVVLEAYSNRHERHASPYKLNRKINRM